MKWRALAISLGGAVLVAAVAWQALSFRPRAGHLPSVKRVVNDCGLWEMPPATGVLLGRPLTARRLTSDANSGEDLVLWTTADGVVVAATLRYLLLREQPAPDRLRRRGRIGRWFLAEYVGESGIFKAAAFEADRPDGLPRARVEINGFRVGAVRTGLVDESDAEQYECVVRGVEWDQCWRAAGGE